jgi:nucleotide-binding universal stress UspA family protein
MSTAAAGARPKETLVVAYDGSPASRRALVRAAAIARRRAVVSVVNVIRAQSVSSRLVTATESERLVQDRLLREAQIFLEDRGIECRTVPAVGDPSVEVLAAVEELRARWLVIGRGDRRHRLRRSTSMRLARGATCDVIVVR